MRRFRKPAASIGATPERVAALSALEDFRRDGTLIKVAIERHTKDAPTEVVNGALKIALGVVATYGVLDEEIDTHLKSGADVEPKVRDALRIGAYQLLITRQQPHAAVNEAVELTRSVRPKAARLANAVLRRISERVESFPTSESAESFEELTRANGFPAALGERIRSGIGEERARDLITSVLERAPVYINTLPSGSSDAVAASILRSDGLEPEPAGAVPQAFLIGNPAAIPTAESIAHDRALVTDLSAQTVAALVAPAPGESLLEVGSGRGTKTILMQSFVRRMGGLAWIHALDLFQFKSRIARTRVSSTGLEGVHAYTGDGTRLDEVTDLPEMFDTIFIDAPCSGTGTLRRHPELIWSTTPEKIQSLVKLSGDLLASAAPRIVQGVTLAFSTCSILPEENARVIDTFLASEAGKDFAIQPIDHRIRYSSEFDEAIRANLDERGMWQTYPSSGSADGHFLALLARSR